MARQLRIQYPNAWYHVMNRGANKNHIFLEPLDYKIFFKVLKEAVKLWSIRIHAYSLMRNHYHLLIETPLGNLSRAMRHINGVYTQKINRKYKRDGALMRGRFKSILIDKDNYALELVRYIHLNGVKAGLYKSAKQDLNSSHRTYMGIEKKPNWLNTEMILRYFGRKLKEAQRSFDVFVQDGIDNEVEKKLNSSKWPALLGSKEFVKKIKEKHFNEKENIKDFDIEQIKEVIKTHEANEVIEKVCRRYDEDPKDVLKSRAKKEARKALIYLLRKKCLMSYSKIGKLAGDISYGAIANVILALNELEKEKFESILVD